MMKTAPLSIVAAAVLFASSIGVSVSSQARAAAHNDAPAAAPAPAPPPPAGRAYVGSDACRRCHQAVYQRWSKTRMANIVTDPREHADVVLPDFNKPDPLLTFKRSDVAFVYGTKWKQRYFKKVGDDYF